MTPAQLRLTRGITTHGILMSRPEDEIALSPEFNENPFLDEERPPDELSRNRERVLSLLDMPKV